MPFVLNKLYGFNVSPQKGVDPEARGTPFGGLIRLSEKVQEVVANATSKVSANAVTTVDFELYALHGPRSSARPAEGAISRA